jgi:hypothetical protein
VEPIVNFYETAVDVVKTAINAIAGNLEGDGSKYKSVSVNKYKSFGNANNGGKVTLKGSSDFFLIAKIKIKSYNLDYAKMSVGQNVELTLEGDLKGSINFTDDMVLFTKSLPTIEFMLGPIPVVLVNDIIFKAKVEAQAQTRMIATLVFKESSEFGFEYSNGWHRINDFSKNFGFDYKHSTYGSIRLGALIGFSSMMYGIAGLEVSAGPSLALKSPSLPLSANSAGQAFKLQNPAFV